VHDHRRGDDGRVRPDRRPGAGSTLGFGPVIAAEHPTRWGGLVDLPEHLDERAAADCVGADGPPPGDRSRFAPTESTAVVWVRPDRHPSAGQTWRPRGTTLITGGTGALGCGWPAGWPATAPNIWCCSAERRRRRRNGRAGDRTRRAGRPVTFAACDITDRDSLSGVLTAWPTRVIRCDRCARGGLARSGPSRLTAAEVAEVAASKSRHAAARRTARRARPRRVRAVLVDLRTWGVGDHAAYAMSNAFLDAYAQYGRQRGVPLLSVAWGPWRRRHDREELQDVLRRRASR